MPHARNRWDEDYFYCDDYLECVNMREAFAQAVTTWNPIQPDPVLDCRHHPRWVQAVWESVSIDAAQAELFNELKQEELLAHFTRYVCILLFTIVEQAIGDFIRVYCPAAPSLSRIEEQISWLQPEILLPTSKRLHKLRKRRNTWVHPESGLVTESEYLDCREVVVKTIYALGFMSDSTRVKLLTQIQVARDASHGLDNDYRCNG
jgi:hypothetical protein